jgi:carbon starvation protein
LAVGTIGVFTSGATIEQPAFRGFVSPAATSPTNLLFPFLFVTIACGACSGFHGLVCSGTTSRQVANETDCREVGYGAMLLEGFVALIALATVAIVANPVGAPGAIYGQGIGRFLTTIIGSEHALAATVFGSMAFSTFVFDTLDVTTRLGRYILQELLGRRTIGTAVVATIATVGAPLAIVLTAESGSKAYMSYWVLFGTSNQLLAALTLLVISVWLKRSGRPYLFTLIPMAFLLVMTMSALVLQAATLVPAITGTAEVATSALANAVVALLLLVLAAYLAARAFQTLRAVPTKAGAARGAPQWSR